MVPTTNMHECEVNYPVWILEFLRDDYLEIYEDLITRRTPQWLKPTDYEDYYDDSITQKLLLWADPDFIEFSTGFIQAVDSIMRHDIPVIHLGSLFGDLVSRK